MKKILFLLVAAFIGLNAFSEAKKDSGIAAVNGQKIYYEVYGEGTPIVLLHGAYMNIEMNWSQMIPELAKKRKVIALEMQGHGHSSDSERPFDVKSMATDVAEVLKYLKVNEPADVVGYSMGGIIALQFIIDHPAAVRDLVIISSTYKSDGWLPQVRNIFQMMTPEVFDATPLKTAYDKTAPDPKHWRDFVAKMIVFNKKEFDLGEENIKKIKSPVLLIMADNDGVDMLHKASFYKLLGGDVSGDMAGLPKSQLAIVPGTTHVSLMMQTDKLLSMINPFLGL